MPESPYAGTFEIRKPSRWWRWLKRMAVSVTATLALYFACQLGVREWTKQQGAKELAAARAEVERSDPDWEWERLNAARKKPPVGENGADLVPRVKKLTPPAWGKAQLDPRWANQLTPEPNVRFAPDLLQEVRRESAASAEAVALARTLKDRPFGHREIVLSANVLGTLLEDTQNTRHVVDLLRWEVILATEDGETARASAALLATLNASRSIGDEPVLVSQLVRFATRAVTVRSAERFIAQTADTPDLVALQAALAADAEEPLLLYGVRGDRAMFDRLYENLANDTLRPEEAMGTSFDTPAQRIGWWHYRVNLLGDRAYTLLWLTQCVEYARRPMHEQPALFASLAVPPDDPNRMLSRLLIPAVDKVAHAHWRNTAEARCAVAGIACVRFRQNHRRWPDELAELVPVFLPAVPLDPYTGEHLKYTKTEAGAAVYSVGKRPLQPSVAPFGQQPAPAPAGLPDGIEFGFRLYNPDQRRLPPLEPPAQERDP